MTSQSLWTNPKTLQDWFDECLSENRNEDALIWKTSAHNQIMWVRDRLIQAIPKSIINTSRPTVMVIGEHMSKSCVLPVYCITTRHFIIVMRDNFYDWNITVHSQIPVEGLIEQLIGDTSYCYFQGFPDIYKCGDFKDNKHAFSFYLNSKESLYTFVWLLSRLK